MGQYYTRYFINDAGTIWSGQAFVRDWSDFSWAKSYEPTPPSGYYEIVHEDNREQYSTVIQKTESVDTTEGELNNSASQSNYIELNTVVSGNLSSSNDVDSYYFQVFEPGELKISIRLDPSADIGSSSRFSTTLLHDYDGDGYLRDDEVYLQADFGESSINSINLNDTGYFYFQVEKGAYHTSNEYRFIVEADVPELTYSIPEGGRDWIIHTGEGVTIVAPVDVFASSNGIGVTNIGTGSIVINSLKKIHGGYQEQTGDRDGIYAWNRGAETQKVIIDVADVTGLDSAIHVVNQGVGDVSIVASGDIIAQNGNSIEAYNRGYVDKDTSIIASGNLEAMEYGIYAVGSSYGRTTISIGSITNSKAEYHGKWAIHTFAYGDQGQTVNISGSISGFEGGVKAATSDFYFKQYNSLEYANLVSIAKGDDTPFSQADIDGIVASGYKISNSDDISNWSNIKNYSRYDVWNETSSYDTSSTSEDDTPFSLNDLYAATAINTSAIQPTDNQDIFMPANSRVTLLKSAEIIAQQVAVETSDGNDTVIVEGSVTGLSGTAISLGAGNDTVTIGSLATITGVVDGGTGSDTANFSVNKSSVDSFAYSELTATAIVTVGNQITTLKDFEYFKFSDDTSAVATADIASVSNTVSPIETIGAIYAVNTGSGSNMVLEFYADDSLVGASVTSFDAVVTFDTAAASYASVENETGYLGFPNETDGVINLSGISLSGGSSADPLFTLTLTDQNTSEDLALYVSDVLINNETLAGSTLIFSSGPITESIGAISALNTGSGTNVSLDFYVDPALIPEDVSSFDMVVRFDSNGAEYVSADIGDFLGFPNASGDTITLSGISLSGVSSSDPLFTLNFTDLDVSEDFAIYVSDVLVNGTSLEGSTLLIGEPDTFDISTTVATRDGSKISDVAIAYNDGNETTTVLSGNDGVSLASITSGSDVTVSGSLDYDSSTKSINSQDALDALRLSVGMDTQSGTSTAFDYIAADFNQDGKVSSQDALAILKYAVGLTTTEQAEWVFVDSDGDYSDISRTKTNYDEGITIADLTSATELSLTGILIGDVNDSYSGLIV